MAVIIQLIESSKSRNAFILSASQSLSDSLFIHTHTPLHISAFASQSFSYFCCWRCRAQSQRCPVAPPICHRPPASRALITFYHISVKKYYIFRLHDFASTSPTHCPSACFIEYYINKTYFSFQFSPQLCGIRTEYVLVLLIK